ncbi:MAG: ATP synthase F0 subunit C [Candidatus Babeliales bacterium]
MIDYVSILHYFSAVLAVACTSIGVGLGQGKIALSIINSMDIAPNTRNEASRIGFMGMAIAETAAVLGVSIAIILLLKTAPSTLYGSIAKVGIAFAIGLSGGVVGYVSYLPASAAIISLARQPFFGPKILNLMLITISLIQTPVIFGFIISYFIYSQSAGTTNLVDAVRFLSSGFCIGVGTIGPTIGLAIFAQAALQAVGYNRTMYNRILSFTFLSEAIIETPIIFALLTSMILITIPIQAGDPFIQVIKLFSSALSMGVSTIAAGINSGKISAQAVTQIARYPKEYSAISRASMIAQGLLDTLAIYGLIISFMLIFVV